MEHGLYLQGIKGCLKAKGITYAELAHRLKMTESGVKKMLNAKDISFRRVLAICDVLDVLPGTLFSSSERATTPTVHLTQKQEEALLKDRRLLAVFWLLAIDKHTPEEIQNIQGLAETSLQTLLLRLVRLGLLTQTRGKFRPIRQQQFRWPDESKLARKLNRDWSLLTLNRALSARHAPCSHRLIAIKLTANSYQVLERRLTEALDEAVHTSAREALSVPKNDLKGVTAVVATVQRGIFDPTD